MKEREKEREMGREKEREREREREERERERANLGTTPRPRKIGRRSRRLDSSVVLHLECRRQFEGLKQNRGRRQCSEEESK